MDFVRKLTAHYTQFKYGPYYAGPTGFGYRAHYLRWCLMFCDCSPTSCHVAPPQAIYFDAESFLKESKGQDDGFGLDF